MCVIIIIIINIVHEIHNK